MAANPTFHVYLYSGSVKGTSRTSKEMRRTVQKCTVVIHLSYLEYSLCSALMVGQHYQFFAMTTFCFSIGICYGFQLMLSHESPNMPFTIFRTRFATGKL